MNCFPELSTNVKKEEYVAEAGTTYPKLGFPEVTPAALVLNAIAVIYFSLKKGMSGNCQVVWVAHRACVRHAGVVHVRDKPGQASHIPSSPASVRLCEFS